MSNDIVDDRNKIRMGRALLGWSQQDLARHANIATSTIADFERNKRTPTAENLKAMKDALEKGGVDFSGGAETSLTITASKQAAIAKAGDFVFRWIDGADLTEWASRRNAQGSFPELISKLIRAETGNEARLRYPAKEGVSQPGWDGTCEIERGTEHIPSGFSAWELGTQGKSITKKADADYQKRLSAIPASEAAKITFVFATLRSWTTKNKWVLKRRQERKWADVKAFDADDLVHWIEKYPSIGQWLATEINKRPSGLQQLEEAWREWSFSTKWPMTPDITLAGREEEATRIMKWLYDEPSALAIQAESSTEAIAFLHAALDRLPTSYRKYYEERCLIARTADLARTLSDSLSPLIIIMDDADPGLIAHITQKKHHVYVVYGSDVGAPDDVLCLPRPSADAFSFALKEMLERQNIKEIEPEGVTREVARSLTIFRRLYPSAPGKIKPEWAEKQRASDFLGALFAGAWNEKLSGDRKALERLYGFEYEKIDALLTRWLTVSDNPIRKVGTTWKIASPRDAWFRLAPYISTTDLDRFISVAVDVIGASDARVDMTADERFFAPVSGGSIEYSRLIKNGLSEALVLLSVFGKQASNILRPEEKTNAAVRQLLGGADMRKWLSLSHQLEILAEAAPRVFLDAINDSLEKSDKPVMSLFAEDKSSFGLGGANHISLLRGLEVLAWEKEYLSETAIVLAKLDQVDPGGRYVNRPGNSLREIFLLWLPQTTASLDERLKVLERLRKEKPNNAAWKLMLGIFPKGYDSSSYSSKPRWRDVNTERKEEATYSLIARGAEKLCNFLLEDVGLDVSRWENLIGIMQNFTPARRQQAVNLLNAVVPNLRDEKARTALWKCLRELLHHHRQFPDVEWALPEEDLKPLEAAYKKLDPEDPIIRISWLFSGMGVPLPTPTGKGMQEDEAAAEKLRISSIESLYSLKGIDHIFKLSEVVEGAGFVGQAIAKSSLDEKVKDEILVQALSLDTPPCRALSYGFIVTSAQQHGIDWSNELIERARTEKWPSPMVLRIFISLSSSQTLWDTVATFGKEIEDEYWKIAPVLWGTYSTNEIIFALEKLLKADRARHALNLAGHNKDKVPNELLIRILTDTVHKQSAEKESGNDAVMFQHWVEEVLHKLDGANDVTEDQIARLEWAYLNVLEYSKRPPIVLHKTLSSNPEFFVQVLSTIYKPDPESGIVEEPSRDAEQDRAMATHAYNLLRTWKLVPGTIGNTVDETVLNDWVRKTRELCKKAGRAGVGDRYIGGILAHAPSDSNGVWPTKPVREIIESLRSRDLESGLFTGFYNKRGVTTRGMTDGGVLERDLAGTLRKYIKEIGMECPRTAAVLDRLATEYEHEGRMHDQDVERLDW